MRKNIKSIKLFANKAGKAGGIPTRVFGTANKPNILGYIGVAAVVGMGFVFGGDLYKAGVQWTTKTITGEAQSSISDATLTPEEKAEVTKSEIKIDIPNENIGTASTLIINSFDRMADTETAAAATGWIIGSKGEKLVNGAALNSSSAQWGDTVSVYAGGSSFLMYEFNEDGKFVYPVEYTITGSSPIETLDVAALYTESSITTKPFDSDKNVLTAETDAGDVDYTFTMGADSTKKVYLKIYNDQQDKLFPLGAICTFSSQNSTVVDDFKIIDSAWEEVDVPKELDDEVLSFTISANTCTQTGYDRCYVPKNLNKALFLDEWDETNYIEATIKSGTTDPTNNSCSGVGVLAVDINLEDGKDGKIYWDFYKHDDDEQVTAVGVDDVEDSPQGKTSGVLIELI